MKRIVKYAAVMAFVSGMPWLGMAQPYLIPQGPEYRITGPLPGEQTHPQAAIDRNGGVLIWQENTGADGALRAKGLRLDGALSATGPVMALDELGAGDQENPQVTLLTGGNALAVWQGGKNGSQKIYSQVVNMSGPDAKPVFMVNSYTNSEQITPAIASTPDGGAFVVWASRGQDGDMLGVYARRLSAIGEPVGNEIKVNQFSDFNQRTPDVVTMGNGNILVAWVSEQQRGPRTFDIYGRLFSSAGVALGKEFLMSDSTNLCANPTLNATADGGLIMAWTQKDIGQETNSWDIYARVFDSNCAPKGPSFIVNTQLFGDQYGPKLATVGSETLVVWTGLAQDGDWQGIYGQYVNREGQKLGYEFRVNTTTIRNQLEPTVVSDGYRRVLAVWTSYIAGEIDFDLLSQQFISTQIASDVRLTLNSVSQGMQIKWNTDSGVTYQVQSSEDCVYWKNLGTSRTATGSDDSIVVGLNNATSFYRVVQLPTASK